MSLRYREYVDVEQTQVLSTKQAEKVVKKGDKILGGRVTKAKGISFGKFAIEIELPVTVKIYHLFGLGSETEKSLKRMILERFGQDIKSLDNIESHSIRFEKKR